MKKVWWKYFNLKEQFKNNKIYFLVKLIFCLMFSISIMLDSILVFNGNIYGKIYDNYFTSIKFNNICILVLTFLVSYLVITLIEFLTDKYGKTIFSKHDQKVKNKKYFWIIFIVILLLWMPYILSFFPGGLFADTIVSISEALGFRRIYNHNPILYTLILKLFLEVGILFSNTNGQLVGLMLFTGVQVITMDLIITYFIYWTYKRGLSKKYIILEVLFFGLFNLFPLYAISLWKDTVFSLVLFLYLIYLADVVYENGKNLKDTKGIIKYSILTILVIFLRNNGVYIIIFTNIILFIVFRKQLLKKFMCTTIITIILCCIIQGPVFNKLNINTEFEENIGVFLQQISYVVAKDGSMTEEQKKYIDSIIPIKVIKKAYTPCITDSIKWNSQFNSSVITSNKSKFFTVWFKLFLLNPDKYTKAYLLNSIGFWDVKKAIYKGYINHMMWPDRIYDYLPKYEQKDYIQQLTNKSIRIILTPHLFISSAIFLVITLLGFIITLYRKKYKNLLIYCPLIATWITIMIATPLAFSLRYVYILVLALPLSILIPFLEIKEE